MENFFGFKELYDVSIKATIPITIGSKVFSENETIVNFDKVMISTLNETKMRQSATGGKGNQELIYWEDTQEVNFSLSHGVLSKEGFSLLSNSQILVEENNDVPIDFKETKETNSESILELKYIPTQDNTLFIYDAATGEKVITYEINDNILTLPAPYKTYIINYTFLYSKKMEVMKVGERLINGYLKLTGKMRLKDDYDGHGKTGIIEIPKIRLMSDLSLRLGDKAGPQVSTFYITGYPIGERREKTVCKIIFLEDEIDGDF